MPLKPDQPIEAIAAKDLLILTSEQKNIQIDRAFNYWRSKGFPYREMSGDEILTNFKRIRDFDSRSIFSGNRIISSTLGLELVNSFHPQIWNAVRWGHRKSPIDYFNDDETLKKLLERGIRLWPDRKCWRDYVVRSMFRIYSGGRVSNFRPTVSKGLIEAFSASGSTILDFCSGFGGRLLGAMPLDRHYVGIDSSEAQIRSNERMYRSIRQYSNCTVQFHNGCAEEVMPGLESGSFNLIFTSPPYFKQEKYNIESSQSYLRYKGYESWKRDFLEQVIFESQRLLAPNGYFIINISNIRGYPLATDFESLATKYFTLKHKYELAMTARPLHRRNGTASKLEPVYIYQKKGLHE